VNGDLLQSEQLADSEQAEREAGAYKRLLAGLDRGEIDLPDDAAREAVEVMVLAIEGDTSYAKIIAEHDALFGLLALLGAAGRRQSDGRPQRRCRAGVRAEPAGCP
jgi:hypothetical protein